MSNQVNVLYIASDSRSGSTVLDLMLGQGDGMFSVGEFRNVWKRSYSHNELCGCGQPFRECAFWRMVSEEAFGSIEAADRAAARFAQHAPTRMRHMPMMLTKWRTPQADEHLAALSEALGRLYAAIQRISGAKVIVDSSKVPVYGLILSRIPNLNVSLIHLVRDSRAVAYSWQRKKLRPEVTWKRDYMPQFGLFHSARAWVLNNLMIEMLAREMKQQPLFLRYEHVVSHPDQVAACTQSFLRERGIEVSFPSYADHTVRVRENHTVSGNPVRLQARGSLHLCLDTEWQERMNLYATQVMTALTLPLLKRYGFLDGQPPAHDCAHELAALEEKQAAFALD